MREYKDQNNSEYGHFRAVDIGSDMVDADCRYLRQSQIHLIISQVSVSLFFLFLNKNAILNCWKNPLTSKFHHQNFCQRFFGTVISLKPTIKLLNKLLKFLINCRLKSGDMWSMLKICKKQSCDISGRKHELIGHFDSPSSSLYT